MEALRVGDVSTGLERLLCHLKTQRDSSQPPHFQVPRTSGTVQRCAFKVQVHYRLNELNINL